METLCEFYLSLCKGAEIEPSEKTLDIFLEVLKNLIIKEQDGETSEVSKAN